MLALFSPLPPPTFSFAGLMSDNDFDMTRSILMVNLLFDKIIIII
jgi:hypothetical protein